MGSFIRHVLPGTLFLLVGLWHTWSGVFRYVSNPKSFSVSVWSPVPGFDGRFKYLELYLIVVGGFIDLCIELLVATKIRFFVNGALDTAHMNNFEHSGMLLMFFIFSVITLLSEKTRRMDWSIKRNTDNNDLNSSPLDDTSGRTQLFQSIHTLSLEDI